MKNFDNVLNFKNDPYLPFNQFIESFKKQDYFSALRKINFILRDDLSVQAYKWKALLLRQMGVPGVAAADCHLKSLFVTDGLEQRTGALFLAETFVQEGKPELANFYIDYITQNGYPVAPDIQSRIDESFLEINRLALANQFFLVDNDESNRQLLLQISELFESKQLEKAEEMLTKIPCESMCFEEANLLIAKYYLDIKNHAKAEIFCMRVLDKSHENPDALVLLAKVFVQTKPERLVEIVAKIKNLPDEFSTQVKFLEIFMLAHEFDDVVKLSRRILNERPYVSQVNFCQGIALFNLGKLAAAKEAFLAASILSEREILARELYLMLDSGDNKLPSKIFIEKGVPKAVISHVLKKVNRFLKLSLDSIDQLGFGELKNILIWAENYLDKNTQKEILSRLLRTKRGLPLVKDFLLAFSTSDEFKKKCLHALCESGINCERLPIVVNKKIKKVKVVFPKGLFSETNLTDSGEWRSDLPVDFSSFSTAFADAFVFLAFHTESFEFKLKRMAERFLFSLQSFPSNLKRLLTQENIVSALVFSVLSDDIEEGKFELSVPGKKTIQFVCDEFGTKTFDTKKLLTEIF